MTSTLDTRLHELGDYVDRVAAGSTPAPRLPARRRRPPVALVVAVAVVALLGAAVIARAGTDTDGPTAVQSAPNDLTRDADLQARALAAWDAGAAADGLAAGHTDVTVVRAAEAKVVGVVVVVTGRASDGQMHAALLTGAGQPADSTGNAATDLVLRRDKVLDPHDQVGEFSFVTRSIQQTAPTGGAPASATEGVTASSLPGGGHDVVLVVVLDPGWSLTAVTSPKWVSQQEAGVDLSPGGIAVRVLPATGWVDNVTLTIQHAGQAPQDVPIDGPARQDR